MKNNAKTAKIMAMNIEVAITLVKQAIDQDKKKNFEEAARCYREAIITFKTVAQFRGISKGLVCPKLFFCKHLSLVVNKQGQRTMKMAGHKNIFGLSVVL